MPVRLSLEEVTTGYGRVEILHHLSLTVPVGSVVALLGPNGAGKTTTLNAISGTIPVWRGAIRLDGARIDGRTPYAIARRGVTLVPEGRGIFPSLSVAENLEIAVRAATRDRGGRSTAIAEVLRIFPRLDERREQRAGTMSGGEQQMLALSRALLADPKVLLMDEISMGLAPLVVESLFEAVAAQKAAGRTIVLVEQYLTYALRFADICYILAKGEIAFVGEPSELRSSAVTSAYLAG